MSWRSALVDKGHHEFRVKNLCVVSVAPHLNRVIGSQSDREAAIVPRTDLDSPRQLFNALPAMEESFDLTLFQSVTSSKPK